MGLRKCENRSGCPRWSFVASIGSAALLLTASIRRTPHPQIYAVGCGDDRASAARLRRADLSTTTCGVLSENDVLRNAVEGGDACPLSAETRRLGMFQMYWRSKVDRGMNRGESWACKGTRGASDMLESVTGLPKCRN